MTQALLVVGVLFVLVYAPLAILAWRRPLLARFAWRESTRRRGQLILLLVGLLAGSASITASLVGGDSATQAVAFITNQRLGATDLTVTAAGGLAFPANVATRLASDPALAPYVDGVQAGVEIPASVANIDQRLGKPGVLVVGFDPASEHRFGAFTLSSGGRTYGEALTTNDVLVSSDLASSIDAKSGDHLRVTSPTGNVIDLRVYGIAATTGPGAYGSPLALYTSLETAQLVTGGAGINVVRVAAHGSNSIDPDAARRAEAPLRSALSRIPSETPLLVNDVRADAANQVLGATGWTLGIDLAFSGLTVLASIALIVNLVLALADERRSRLAVLRAMGLTRSGLVALSVLEGAIYSVAAAMAGVVVGVVAGFFVAAQTWNAWVIDPGLTTYSGIPMQLTVRAAPVALGFSVGALITLAAVAATAYRTSRMAIAEAIRDLPEPAALAPGGWPRTFLLIVSVTIGAALLIPNDPRPRLVGGVALIVTVAAVARGRLSDRARVTIGGLLASAWAVIMVASDNKLTSDLGQLIYMVVLGVAIPAIGLSVAAAANLGFIDAALGMSAKRLGLLHATLRPPLAYLSRRPVRTGLVTSAFALVLVLVSLIAVAVASTSRDYARDSAGFDIEVVSSGADPVRLPPEIDPQVASKMTIPVRLYQGPWEAPGFGDLGSSVVVPFYVLPDQMPDRGPVHLSGRDKRFTTDADVWRAVRADPGLVVYIGSSGAVPGDEIPLQGPNGQVHLRVAAIEATTVLNGVIGSADTASEVATSPSGSVLLLKAVPGSDPRSMARQIEQSLFEQGVQATTIREILDQDYASSIAYTTEYDVVLHMGLLVGVLALAMIGIRATIERRRAIGILRALGYQPWRVLTGLIAEAAATATIGVIAGIGAGLVIGYIIVGGALPGGVYAVDLPRLIFALAIVYGTVVLVTGPLASRAARMAPTEAIRLSS